MRKIIISLICCLLPAFAVAETLSIPADAQNQIRDDAPDRYTVSKGDTLWDIAAKFLKDPWRWPQVWGLNKETIKNPHWIYPGDVVVLDRRNGTLSLKEEHLAAATPPPAAASSQTATSTETSSGLASSAEMSGDLTPLVTSDGKKAFKLSPHSRVLGEELTAIPSIPLADIAPYLKRPLVVEENAISTAPVIVGGEDSHFLLGTYSIAYVKDLPSDMGSFWQVFRPGKALLDPSSGSVLGYEAIYLGDAHVEKFGEVSTTRLTQTIQEIYRGDRLLQPENDVIPNYVPHAPAAGLSARVVSIFGGVTLAGQNMVVTINKGRQDGLEPGHVLALYRKGEVVSHEGQQVALPDVRYGLLIIFRVFNKISYGLVMQTRMPVQVLDTAQTP